MILQILISILLGLFPEVLFFTLFIIYTKRIKNKKIMLFLLIALAYMLCMFIKTYSIFCYILLIVLIYIIMKILYKNKVQIIDIFIISIGFIYISILSFICSILLRYEYDNLILYYILYIFDRIFMFLPFIKRDKFYYLYKIYCSLWNRNDNEKRPIKSLTLRNISLVVINISIFLGNIYLISIIN